MKYSNPTFHYSRETGTSLHSLNGKAWEPFRVSLDFFLEAREGLLRLGFLPVPFSESGTIANGYCCFCSRKWILLNATRFLLLSISQFVAVRFYLLAKKAGILDTPQNEMYRLRHLRFKGRVARQRPRQR